MARIPVEQLRSVLTLREDGVLVWSARVANNVFPGMEAGTVDGQGYKHFMYKKTVYPCHQVVWALTHGEWSGAPLDHINGERADNRPSNLRLATVQQNCANRRIAKNNKSGAKGVRWKAGKWEVAIGYTTADGKRATRYLGRMDDFDLAAMLYAEAADQMNGRFAWGG